MARFAGGARLFLLTCLEVVELAEVRWLVAVLTVVSAVDFRLLLVLFMFCVDLLLERLVREPFREPLLLLPPPPPLLASVGGLYWLRGKRLENKEIVSNDQSTGSQFGLFFLF